VWTSRCGARTDCGLTEERSGVEQLIERLFDHLDHTRPGFVAGREPPVVDPREQLDGAAVARGLSEAARTALQNRRSWPAGQVAISVT